MPSRYRFTDFGGSTYDFMVGDSDEDRWLMNELFLACRDADNHLEEIGDDDLSLDDAAKIILRDTYGSYPEDDVVEDMLIVFNDHCDYKGNWDLPEPVVAYLNEHKINWKPIAEKIHQDSIDLMKEQESEYVDG